MKEFVKKLKANARKIASTAASVMVGLFGAVAPVAAESPGVLNNIVSESATATSGIVANMQTIITFITSNPYLLALLGIAFAAMSGSALIKWIRSISL